MAVFGETLRQARAYKGVTLKEAEQATRINRHHLAALEDENFAALPPLIYQRGIVRNYASYLDLDPNKILTIFEDAHGTGATAASPVAVKPLDMPSHFTPNFAIIAFLVVLSAIVFAWVYSVYRGPDDSLPTPTMQTTVTPLATRNAALPVDGTATATPVPSNKAQASNDASPSATGGRDASSSVATEEARRPMSEANQRRTQTAQRDTSGGAAALATQPASQRGATATPSPSANNGQPAADSTQPAATSTPRDTPTPAAQATTDASDSATQQAESDAATQVAANGPQVTVSFAPSADVYLTVIGDGTVLYDGSAGAGQTVGPFTASSFSVYTSDPASTYITNEDTGSTFYMSTNSFTLAPES